MKLIRGLPWASLHSLRNVSYVQGQSPGKNLREYFYYIDHQGMLFLDDSKMKNFTSCFKGEEKPRLSPHDKDFLVFFFKRIRLNETDRYSEFPYVSLCGRERNFIRCDDTPLVYTHVTDSPAGDAFCYAHVDALRNPFEPNKLFMDPITGRVYHPCGSNYGSVGLVQSKLAVEFSRYFTYSQGDENSSPTHFTWKGVQHELDNSWYYQFRRTSTDL